MKAHLNQASNGIAMSVLRESIQKIVGPEFIKEEEIQPDSRISEDLKLDQFDVYQLRDEIFQHFGKDCDLFSYMYHLDIDQIIELTVGNIAGFVSSYTSRAN